MKKKLMSKPVNKVILTVSILIAVLLIIAVSAYLYVSSFIHKMNLVEDKDIITVSASEKTGEEIDTELVPEEEDTDVNVPEATETEIASLEDELKNNMERNQTEILKDKDVLNILLIGSDTRKTGQGGRSDAMILVSINKKNQQIAVTSILRDIYLKIPGYKQSNRINAAYAYGGASLLMDTIEQNFKVKVDKYVAIDFFAFIDMVDAVGGVKLEVSEQEIPVINEYVSEINLLRNESVDIDLLRQPGLLLLNGKQALGYARNRYVGNADFERTARQRRVLEQTYSNLKNLSLKELKDLLNKILPQITTNLSEGDIFSLLLSLPAIKSYEIEQGSIPVNNSYSGVKIRGMAVLSIDFNKNISELQQMIYK
ncbi:MAG: LCP family protein [Mobilitalea sp.]